MYFVFRNTVGRSIWKDLGSKPRTFQLKAFPIIVTVETDVYNGQATARRPNQIMTSP